MKFSKQKNGYNEKEVDDYISSLSTSYEKLIEAKEKEVLQLRNVIEEVKEKESTINLALTAAVDKAKEIEESSQNIYKLKLEQLSILYAKWEKLLSEMIKKYPDIEGVSDVKNDMNNLKTSIKSALKDDLNIELMSKTPATDPIRILLARLTGRKADAESRENSIKTKVIERKTRISSSSKTDLAKLEERTSQIKPIANVNLEKGEDFENLVDKFLNTDDEIDLPESFSKVISAPDYSKNQQGKFDLNEAINPKEDLEEIMKSFDFYKKS